jgi:hypothetical protein
MYKLEFLWQKRYSWEDMAGNDQERTMYLTNRCEKQENNTMNY